MPTKRASLAPQARLRFMKQELDAMKKYAPKK
jgi:hypothetical protein